VRAEYFGYDADERVRCAWQSDAPPEARVAKGAMITIRPIATVRNSRVEVEDDYWGGVLSEIVMEPDFGEESIRGLEAFSHVEVTFHFHLVDEKDVVTGARHPRNNPNWPLVGIFAQRAKKRPNRLGLAVARIVERKGAVLTVRDLDAVDGTPIVDLKPVMREFLPSGDVRQAEWSTELMRDYWKNA
jgi:tRNA-Thr(GGU) m(6)t(6)A37 methyltransferase TsaA